MGRSLSLDYLRAGEIAAFLEGRAGHVLGVVAFGARPAAADPDFQPPLWVNIPVLGGYDSSFEVWTSEAPVVECSSGSVRARADGSVLFGSLQLDQAPGVSLESLANRAYSEIFDFVDRHGYQHLLRIWNYFPRINEPEGGLERYRSFNVGRHEAYVASGRNIGEESVPAASALGSDDGPLIVYFLAGKQPGKPVNNPRQVSAYRYPQQFGPRSPTFARAMMVTLGAQQCFIISGTASIVGYESMHHGDAARQAEETLLNIQTLLHQIPEFVAQGIRAQQMVLKVYLRHGADIAAVKDRIERAFGPGFRAVYLQSNVCRSDLLLEIEGVYFSDSRQ